MPTREPIAIVGIGCRYPGVSDLASFWKVLRDGVETVGTYPGGRFEYLDQVFSSDSVSNGSIATLRGGFLPDLAGFDAEFFNISPREASFLDPQQRLLMEVAWEALENAGIPAEKIAGTRTGVYVGLWTSDYEHYIYESMRELDFYTTTGSGRYPASGRLAYFLDLRGPNLTVDTACSSSLVAIHLACESIRSGASEMALAGGVNVILRPETTLSYSGAKMLSPDGHCKFGDATANGYVRSEGAGIVLLKPLHRALADNDPVHAVIRGGAINNDGRSSGLLIAPSREGQRDLLRTALRDAELNPEEVEYVEAHGTGTLVGDPVEIDAISAVMGGDGRRAPCLIGSVKTNLGHTESAAGVAGVIKVALSLKQRTLPGSLHLNEPNPQISWGDVAVKVQTKTEAWPTSTKRPCAGVSGFGITGTNAHVILQAAPEREDKKTECESTPLFLLSAQTSAALEARATSWLDRLKTDPGWPLSLPDLTYSAAIRQTHHDFRLALVAGNRAELMDQLAGFLSKEEDRPYVRSGQRLAKDQRRVVFVFSGQGGQWQGMGRTLLANEPVFREALMACDRAFGPLLGWGIVDRLHSNGADALQDIDVVQPVLFSFMVALAAWWRSIGIAPDAVVGHSMGEVAAAVVAGMLSLEDGAAVIAHRSRLMKTVRGRGAMAVAQLGTDAAEEFLRSHQGKVSIAAINAPTSIVLSGDADAIDKIVAELEGREIFCRRVKVDVASHSFHMDTLAGDLVDALHHVRPNKAPVPLYSTTTGNVEDGTTLTSAHWGNNLRQPVLFAPAIKDLLRDGFDTFIEMSPHPVLSPAIEESAAAADVECAVIPSMHRDSDEELELINAIGGLHVSGFTVPLGHFFPIGACIDLPLYPWQRKRHWLEEQQRVRRESAVEGSFANKGAADCLYELKWEPMSLPLSKTHERKAWVLFGNDGGVADQLGRLLRSHGDVCSIVSDADKVGAAIQYLGCACSGVICLPSTNNNGHAAMDEAWRITKLVKNLAGKASASPPPLWLITTGAQVLPGDTPNVAVSQAVAWGMSGVIEAEYPEWKCINVDCSFSPTSEELQSLVVLLHNNGTEDRVAVRGNVYRTARFAKSTATSADRFSQFSASATYLITGGLGGIALEVARWMVTNGARHIALLGRRAPSEDAQKQIASLNALGASVRILQADISEENQVQSVLKTVAEEMPPLRGIFHLAAVMDGALLSDVREDQVHSVMRSKVAGAWALHHQTKSTPLDFFVLFSSITASLTQPGLAAYAAANAFLDSLARHRKAEGLSALSVEWSPWLQVGLVNDQRVQGGMTEYIQQGIRGLEPQAALEVLRAAIKQNAAVSYIFPADWKQFAKSFGNSPPPRTFLNLVQDANGLQDAPVTESLRDKLLAVPAGRARRIAIETHVQEILAKVLKTDVSRIDPSKTMGSMGVDSLMAVQIVRQLTRTSSVKLPATSVFNYPTVRVLGAELAKRMGVPLQADEATAISKPKPVLDFKPNAANVSPSEIADLSEEEALRSLTGSGGTS